MTTGGWAAGIGAVTLFVEDLAAARTFYADTLGLELKFETDDSAVFAVGDVLVNLLRADAAPELVDPAPVAPPGAGVRFVFTVEVEDVDAECARLVERGVELLNGPLDRPWGPRTASFRDPSGHVWELAMSAPPA